MSHALAQDRALDKRDIYTSTHIFISHGSGALTILALQSDIERLIVDALIPQDLRGQTVDVVRLISQEHIQRRMVDQLVTGVSVPQDDDRADCNKDQLSNTTVARLRPSRSEPDRQSFMTASM